MKRASAGQQEQNTELNITPMIDCVFLLLIFFVVTMKYPEIERNMPANLPKATAEGKEEQEPEKEVIRYYIRLVYDESRDPNVRQRLRSAVTAFKQAEVRAQNAATAAEREGQRELAEELRQRIPRPEMLAQGAQVRSYGALDGQLMLLERSAEDADVQIILDADREVPFMFVARVQEVCLRRGFNKISFAEKRER